MAKPDGIDTGAELSATVVKLRAILNSIELHGEGEHPSTIQDVARISTALVTACAELRQHAKSARRQLASYTIDQILEHLKSLPEKLRDDVVCELTGSDREESLL